MHYYGLTQQITQRSAMKYRYFEQIGFNFIKIEYFNIYEKFNDEGKSSRGIVDKEKLRTII